MEEAFQLALDSVPFLLKGAYYTVILSLGGMFFGLVMGFGLALMRLSRFKLVSWIARMYVSSQAVAEEVVGDAWIAILRGLGAFEGRSSLRTWMYRILANIAKTRGAREGRSRPFSALIKEDEGTAVPDAWFRGLDDPGAGGWSTFPNDWRGIPEDRLLAGETLRVVGAAIDALPPLQAEVIRLRDVLGWTSEEVRNALDLSETNQRVLLHRARARVRRAVDEYLEKGQQE